jgi:hypothetical protein
MFKVFAGLIVMLGMSVVATQPGRAQAELKTGAPIVLPPVAPEAAAKLKAESAAAPAAAAAGSSYPDPPASKGKTYIALRTNRGTTTPVPEEDVIRYCGDKAGCNIHIGMHNWDDQGRVASQSFVFFYNRDTGVWRASTNVGDSQGTNANNVTEHVNQSWSCYFTDGLYSNFNNLGDTDRQFGVLSWNQYNADCWVTLMVN